MAAARIVSEGGEGSAIDCVGSQGNFLGLESDSYLDLDNGYLGRGTCVRIHAPRADVSQTLGVCYTSIKQIKKQKN